MPDSPEALVVGLARTGDREAFADLVRRRQSWIRNLQRRLCGDPVLADDLAQQTFLEAWKDISRLREAHGFGAWLKQMAINVWRQHARRNDPLREAQELADAESLPGGPGLARDLDAALALLPPAVRLCVVLSYHEGMSHTEIAAHADLPVGTVKSHVRRGTRRLRTLLTAYRSDTE